MTLKRAAAKVAVIIASKPGRSSAMKPSSTYGAAVVNPLATTLGYQGPPAPNQWFGGALSARAGSLALMDASGVVVVDAMVYGSQQSNSSANGTIASPEIAVLEADQDKGGCIVVAPAAGGFGPAEAAASAANRSVGRFPDGFDADSNCTDFLLQPATTLPSGSAAGATNIKVASVAGFSAGQTIMIDTGANLETAVIAAVGTAGATTVSGATDVGATVIPVASGAGFAAGQTIAIAARSNLHLEDVRRFRALFNLPARDPVLVLPGRDPGTAAADDLGEATLAAEWAGALAPAATIDLVAFPSSSTTDGVFLSAQYIVNKDLAPILSVSYGLCEPSLGPSGNSFFHHLWQQAAAEGITVLVCSGDSGAAGCDPPSAPRAALGRAVNGICSPAESTCVGGTEFDDATGPSPYWTTANGPADSSATGYIPEAAWNEAAGTRFPTGSGTARRPRSSTTWRSSARG